MRRNFEQLTDLRVIAIAVTVIFGCTIAGPFGTVELPLWLRAIYWSSVLIVAFFMSLTIIFYFYEGPLLKRIDPLIRGVTGALVFSMSYSVFLVAATPAILGDGGNVPSYLDMLLYSGPIAVAITIIVHLFRRSSGDLPATYSSTPRLVKRLKPELGQKLLRLSMQDHYVEAFTDKGSQLVLMRFTDALAELDEAKGWRIHRSHWVAEAAITDMRRFDGKTFVVLGEGVELPVSRTYLPKLKDAGVVDRFLS
ncbi:MAG: LytTR family DNA-binding domain-containing protein [Pikeienuella sp.]